MRWRGWRGCALHFCCCLRPSLAPCFRKHMLQRCTLQAFGQNSWSTNAPIDLSASQSGECNAPTSAGTYRLDGKALAAACVQSFCFSLLLVTFWPSSALAQRSAESCIVFALRLCLLFWIHDLCGSSIATGCQCLLFLQKSVFDINFS